MNKVICEIMAWLVIYMSTIRLFNVFSMAVYRYGVATASLSLSLSPFVPCCVKHARVIHLKECMVVPGPCFLYNTKEKNKGDICFMEYIFLFYTKPT